MLEFIAGLAVGAATMLTLGARWRRKRRRVDELHAEMLAATWAVQDQATFCQSHPTTNVESICGRDDEMLNLQEARNTAARRYVAAVGE